LGPDKLTEKELEAGEGAYVHQKVHEVNEGIFPGWRWVGHDQSEAEEPRIQRAPIRTYRPTPICREVLVSYVKVGDAVGLDLLPTR